VKGGSQKKDEQKDRPDTPEGNEEYPDRTAQGQQQDQQEKVGSLNGEV
jgi:hypothetical protein